MNTAETVMAKMAGAMKLELVREPDGRYTVETEEGEIVNPPTDASETWDFLHHFATGYYGK